VNTYKSDNKFLYRNIIVLYALLVALVASHVIEYFNVFKYAVDIMYINLLLAAGKAMTGKAQIIYDRVDVDNSSILIRKNSDKKYDTSFRMSYKNIVNVSVRDVLLNDMFSDNVCKAYIFKHNQGKEHYLRYDINDNKQFENDLKEAGVQFTGR